MSRLLTHSTSVCLIGMGAFVWVFAGRPLAKNPDLTSPVNPFGINRGPYGEVFAMAMQGPIDTYFHGSISSGAHRHTNSENCSACQNNVAKSQEGASQEGATSNLTIGQRFENFLSSLDKVAKTSTNPNAPGKAHKLYLRRQVEDKLRFAYQLDPSHYGNYNSLHFFLTEPQLGTRPELTPSAEKLARDTIHYCLKQANDPRASLTAAAAATNILHLMFADQQNQNPQFTPEQMRQYLKVLDDSIARFNTLAKQWDETKNWDLLSPQRIQECNERLSFICNIRKAAEGAIARFETKYQDQASN